MAQRKPCASWEDPSGTPVNPASITGFGFGISIPEEAPLNVVVWIDDFQVIP